MTRITTVAMAVALALSSAACGGKKDAGGGGSAAGSAAAPTPVACAPGSLPGKGGACTVVITAPKVAAVAAQKTRIDELGALLDKVDALSAPVELLDGFRQLPEWKQLAAASDKLKVVDTVVATLSDAVKQIRAFRGQLGEVSQRLGNLRGELDKLVAGTGVAKNLDDARAQISGLVKDLVAPYAQQTSDTIQKAIAPLAAQLSDVADLVSGACAMAKLSGGGDQLKALCGKAHDVFGQATAFLDQIKAKPAALFDDVTKELVGQLDALLDDATRAAIGAAQKQVDQALALPAAGGNAPAGSGSGSGS